MSDYQPQGQVPPVAAEGPGHELSDLKVRSLFLFLAGLVALTVVVLILGIFTMSVFLRVKEKDELLRPALFKDQEGQFPSPRLQDRPKVELSEFRAAERQITETYGWVDKKAGIARIPVDRAIEILAERDLPKGRNTPPRGSRTRDQK